MSDTRIIVLNELQHEQGLNRYNNIIAESRLNLSTVVAGALNYNVNYYKDIDIDLSIIDNIFNIEDKLDPDAKTNNLIAIADHLMSIESNIIFVALNTILTNHVNFYIQHFMELGAEIDDFCLDIKDLLPILSQRASMEQLDNMYNIIVDVLKYNHMYRKTLLNIIKDDKVKYDNEEDVYMYTIPIIHISPLAALGGTFSLSRKLLTEDIIGSDDIDNFEILDDIYEKSDMFKRYGFIEIALQTSTANTLSGIKVITVFRMPNDVFKIVR